MHQVHQKYTSATSALPTKPFFEDQLEHLFVMIGSNHTNSTVHLTFSLGIVYTFQKLYYKISRASHNARDECRTVLISRTHSLAPKERKKPALEAFTKIIFLDITGSRLCVRTYPINSMNSEKLLI